MMSMSPGEVIKVVVEEAASVGAEGTIAPDNPT